MSLLPGESLHYAESHFKFKLPWSLLYKPWPEILVDAPFQFVPGVTPTLWIVIRDAHRFPVRIEKIHFQIYKDSNEKILEKDASLDILAQEQFGFYPIEIGMLPPGKFDIHCQITVSKEDGFSEKENVSRNDDISRNVQRRTFSRWNLPGLKPKPLKIQILEEDLPKAPGFVAGETHCHTHYSADHVEHGATPAVFQQAANAVGLDFVSCTDHAYDFAFLTEDYTKEAESPYPRFNALRQDVARCNELRDNVGGNGSARALPLMIAGEEVSAGNSKKENVHLTVMGPRDYLPGLGDCGRNWLDNKPTFSLAKITDMTEAHCFAAHPHQQMGLLEKFVFRRGYWSSEDLQSKSRHPVRGIQFWNGIRDEGFKLGREWWIQELGKENFVLPIGGNDAHGDLNDTTAVNLPLISLKHSREHVFGNVRTVVKLNADDYRKLQDGSAGLTLEMLNRAFNGDNCYITDGPALWWERNDEATENAEVNETSQAVTFHARSNNDLGGGFRYIRIYGRRRLNNGKLAPREELHLASQVAARPATDIKIYFDDYAYLRAECETATGKFALTSTAVKRFK